MQTNNRNANRLRPRKPIGRMNMNSIKQYDMVRRYNKNNSMEARLSMRPTAGLGLQLADNANKYSKMKMQGEI